MGWFRRKSAGQPQRRPGQQDLHPSGVASRWKPWFGSPQSMQRQIPTPLGSDEKYTNLSHLRPPNGMEHYYRLPDFDYGSQAFTAVGGMLDYNPIGGGVPFTKQLPIDQFGQVAQVINHTYIAWTAQMRTGPAPGEGPAVPGWGGAGPNLSPLYSPDQIRAMVGPYTAEAMVPPSKGPPDMFGNF